MINKKCKSCRRELMFASSKHIGTCYQCREFSEKSIAQKITDFENRLREARTLWNDSWLECWNDLQNFKQEYIGEGDGQRIKEN